ncbi:MAG: hypothetical protein EBV95_06995, partial [Actinobacteria bacterium]|nr:hypothetical protein [Actinomycetota bacterium]
PTAVLSSSVTALNASTTALISITLSEASATFDANDLNVLGGTITSFGGTGSTNYTALFTPAVGYTGVGVVEIPVGVFGDAAGNLSTSVYALPLPLTVDTVSPTAVVSTDKSGGLKAGESATLTFTVSEGGVSGFEAADVAVNGVTGSGLITNFGGTGTTYTATFTPTATTMSTAVITVPAGVFRDAAGNLNTSTGATLSVPVDLVRPTAVLSSSVTALNASTRTALISITLSEASPSFSDLNVQVVGGSLSGFGGSALNYTATFTPQENYSGAASLKIGANSFEDAAGNRNADEVVQALTVDMVAPSVTVVSTDKPGGLKAGESATLTFTVSEGGVS